MKTRLLLLVCAGSALLMPMCQDVEGPMAAGSVTAVDSQADALLQQARGLMAQGKNGKAVKILKKLLLAHPLAPCAPDARFALGQAYEGMRDYREAFKQYGKVIEEQQGSPLYTAALNRQLAMATSAVNAELKVDMFGGLWKTQMESGVVKEWLNSIIKNAPYHDMSAQAMSLYGRYLLKLGEQDQACAVFTKLAENYSDSPYAPEAQLQVARIWASSRTRGNNNSLVNLNKALEAYEEFTLRFPRHPEVGKARTEIAKLKAMLVQQQLDVGRYYLERSHEYRSAVFCFEDVIRQESQNPKAAAEARRLLPKARQLMGAPR